MLTKSHNDDQGPATIGIIVAGSAPPIEGFRERLAELGWIEKQDVNLLIRIAEGRLERLPAFAAEIAGLKVDLIAVIGAVTARAVQKATSNIPIVFAVVVEPVGDGLVNPGSNVTGVTTFDPQQAIAQLQFLKAINPDLSRVAILSDAGVSECLSNSNREASRSLGLEPHVIRVNGPSPNYESAFSAMQDSGAEAVMVLEEPINAACRKQIAELARVRRLPTVFSREQADAGGLIAYGTSLRDAARHMADYASKILRGATPAELPISPALRHELVINLTTAREIGVTVPDPLLDRATLLID